MSVECKYAVLVTAIGSDHLEYSFPLYSNLEQRSQILYEALQISIRVGGDVMINGVPTHLVRVSRPFKL